MSIDVSMDRYMIYTYHGVLCVCVCVCVCILSHSVVSDSLRPHGLQLSRPPCPSLSPRVFSNSCPLSQWCDPTISLSAAPSLPALNLSFLASGSFPMSRLFASGGQSIGVRFSISPSNKYSGLISFLSKRLSRVFSKITVWKHQFFSTQSSLWSDSHIHTWLLGKP